ncbi:glycerophosphodiester phosphodiesterase [Luteimonas sp. WGS1318]|uniref:glycerophosphodiester phosphodiesterase n=1 Tax=Luteimonas sp. WGS1318 TaxID=3366815 RepID=UPI00372D43F0
MLTPLLALAACTSSPMPPTAGAAMPDVERPLLIAHRGASAVMPEHTLAAYARAIDDGADAIEPDLVSTRDGVLVARHENEIGGTTDIAAHPEFAARRTRKKIDGEWVDGWFTEDFTLAELKTLRAREPRPTLRPTVHDGQFEVPTLDEIVALAAEASARTGRDIALVPELKHPSYFRAIGLPMEDRLLTTLAAHPYTRRAPVIIQSFETGNLRVLRTRLGALPNVRLLQLLGDPRSRPYDLAADSDTTYGAMMQPDGLRAIAAYADLIGPPFQVLQLQRGADGRLRSPLVDAAHAAGLQVMPYTFRPENTYLPAEYRDGDDTQRNDDGSIRHIRDHVAAGIDGLFADDPAVARRALDGG